MREHSNVRVGLPAFILVAAAAVLGGCLGAKLEPLPLDVTLQANKQTASVGDTIAFQTNAQGSSLFGVAVDFGDSRTATYDAQGARTVKIVFSHAYDASGTYLVRATATDQTLGSKDASLQIAVP